jgi:hypothetical protein
MSDDRPSLGERLAGLPDKTRPPASISVLNDWVNQADLKTKAGGRLAWLVASTVVVAALQRAVDDTKTPHFLLKGGTLLQHRLGQETRATKDIDGLIRGDIEEFLAALEETLALPWGPLTLRRERLEVIRTPARVVKPRRFDVVVELKGRTWRRIQVEISPDEGGAGSEHEAFLAPRLGSVGLPLRFQVAQKIHACTDPHQPPDAINDRPRDVVDLLLLRDLGVGPLSDVRAAVLAIFDARAKDARELGRAERPWPVRVTAHGHWETDYERARASAGIALDLPTAVEAVNTWLDEIDAARPV